ncbi:MAG: S1 RNA-binding domain-containing protein, partial [Deltaproteobacteria bacterium]|nr:S1 RNA-binding domain-containing protein [Deltaproteobacteria bacterium]
GKIDGAVDRAELLDEEGELAYGAGDSIALYIVSVLESEIKLSRALSGIGGLDILRDVHDNAIPIEGRVTQTCKGGFNVDILHRRAFCPISQIDLTFVETPDDYVGQTCRFLITQLEENGRNIVVSRRKLLEQKQEKALKKYFEKVNIGSVLDGRVTRIAPYGAFVELTAGLEGMVHVSELSWSRTGTPEEVVSAGQELTVKIIDIQAGDSTTRSKIALSVKQLENDPWDTVADRFKAGEKVTGIVTKCMKFGAFVEISPGIEGLIHISEMSYTKHIIYPEDVVSSGQTVSVMVKSCDPENRRISLSLRDAEGDPWLNVPEKYRAGQSVKGSIEKKENFGYFVLLEPGVTGLLPKSNMSKAARPGMIERLKEGDTVNVVVEKVDAPGRRITLGPADLSDEGDWKDFVSDSEATMSPLAEKLKKALDDKK